MKHLLRLVLAGICLVLVGCSGHTASEITHLPFKADEEDRWGMIGVDGKVLFENEFENEPSAVRNGIFFVKNLDGLYEYYTAETKPKRINNKAYLAAGAFIEDVAPVVEPEQPISFIRRDGTTAFVLDKYKNEPIKGAWNFNDGMAIIHTAGGEGFINPQGEIVIEPRYRQVQPFSEGAAVVWNEDNTGAVIDKTGKKLFDLKDQKIRYLDYHNDLMACVDVQNFGKYATSGEFLKAVAIDYFLDKQGKKVMSIPSNIIVSGGVVHNHMVCYQSSEDKTFAGIMDKKGQMIIRPKYDVSQSGSAEVCIEKGFICMADKGKWGLIDFDDNIICPFEFDQILPFYDGQHAFCQEREILATD